LYFNSILLYCVVYVAFDNVFNKRILLLLLLLKLYDGAQMAIFGDFFASCISSEPRAAGFRPAS